MKNYFLTSLCSVILALAALVPKADAAMSEWATSEGGRMRLVVISQPRNESIFALLQIEPKPGWKTYWRNPGDAGMPPELDFSRSSNLALTSISFPTPEIGKDDGGAFIGYHHPVSILLEFARLDSGAPSTLALNGLVGICDKICLPFMADFSLPLTPGTPEGEEFTLVQAAQQALPAKRSRTDFGVTHIGAGPDMKSIEVEFKLPSDGMPEAAVAAPGIDIGKPELTLVGSRHAKMTIPLKSNYSKASGAKITLLVKSGGRAMETELALD